jgi:sugar/nucleoside kinase (ribokinase family)
MENVLFGLVCLDIYTKTGVVRPGSGILHNAFHLHQLGCNPLLITRIGSDNSREFVNFFRRNNLAILTDYIMAEGVSASIEVAVQPSGEAIISNFSRGVGQNFRLNQAEEIFLAQAAHVHVVMVQDVMPEFVRLSRAGLLKDVYVSADFLAFQDLTVEAFAQLVRHVDIAFIGWKGDLKSPTIEAIKQIAKQQPILVVITLGDQGIQLFDSRDPAHFQARFFEIEKVTVRENTNGCGDAFISYFLAEYWRSCHLERAIAQGKIGGAKATEWQYALPEWAYETL